MFESMIFPFFAVWWVPSDRFLADTSQERSYMRPGIQLCWSRVQEISSRRGSFPLSLMHLWTNIRGSKETIEKSGSKHVKTLSFPHRPFGSFWLPTVAILVFLFRNFSITFSAGLRQWFDSSCLMPSHCH